MCQMELYNTSYSLGDHLMKMPLCWVGNAGVRKAQVWKFNNCVCLNFPPLKFKIN